MLRRDRYNIRKDAACCVPTCVITAKPQTYLERSRGMTNGRW